MGGEVRGEVKEERSWGRQVQSVSGERSAFRFPPPPPTPGPDGHRPLYAVICLLISSSTNVAAGGSGGGTEAAEQERSVPGFFQVNPKEPQFLTLPRPNLFNSHFKS